MPIEVLASGLVLFALIFVFTTGANDGGVLIAMGVRYCTMPIGLFVAILFVALSIAPLLFGLAVARTLATGLVPRGGEGAATLAFFLGTGAALLVVAFLSRAGLPTSLTLAIVGGISGSAAGLDLAVAWSLAGWVLLVAALAPVVGALLGLFLGRIAEYLPRSARLGDSLPRLHVVAFLAQCIAYAVNDGQKMIAVVAVAGEALTGDLTLLNSDAAGRRFLTLMGISLVFVVGMLSTLHKVSARIGLELAPVRPLDAVVAQFAAAGAVLGSSAAGAPVSMTQSVAAGLVGVSGGQGIRRVRWQSVTRIAAAWVVTLPMAAAAAYTVGAAVNAAR